MSRTRAQRRVGFGRAIASALLLFSTSFAGAASSLVPGPDFPEILSDPPALAPSDPATPTDPVALLGLAFEALRRPYYAQLAGAPVPEWAPHYAWHLAALQNPVLDPGFEAGAPAWVLDAAEVQEGRLVLPSGASAKQSFGVVESPPDALLCSDGCPASSPVTAFSALTFHAEGAGLAFVTLVDSTTGHRWETAPVPFLAGVPRVDLADLRPERPVGMPESARPEEAHVVDIAFQGGPEGAIVDDVVLEADLEVAFGPAHIRPSLDKGPIPPVERTWREQLSATLPAHDGLSVLVLPLSSPEGLLALLVEHAPSGPRALAIDPASARVVAEGVAGLGVSVAAAGAADALASPYARLLREAGFDRAPAVRFDAPAGAAPGAAWRAEVSPVEATLFPAEAAVTGFLNLAKLLDPANPANDALDLVPDAAATSSPGLFADLDHDGFTDLLEATLLSDPADPYDVPGRDPAAPRDATAASLAAVRKVNEIRAPLSTMPAFLAPEERLVIELAAEVESLEGLAITLSPSHTGISPVPSLALEVAAVSDAREPSRAWGVGGVDAWRIEARLPEGVGAAWLDRLHDLTVTWDGGADTQPRAVKLVSQYAEQPLVVILADPQVGDPRALRDGLASGNAERVQTAVVTYTGAPENVGDEWAAFREAAREVNILRPDLVLVPGDLGFAQAAPGSYQAEYDAAWSILQTLEVPTFLAPGNHDGYAASGQDGFAYWEAYFGPTYYSFDYGDVHGVALNTYDWGYLDRLGASYAVSTWGGQVQEAQLAWLEADFAAAKGARYTFVFGHHSPSWEQDAWQDADLSNATQPPEADPESAWRFWSALFGALGRHVPAPLDFPFKGLAGAPSEIPTGGDAGDQEWTGRNRLTLRDALRAGGVDVYFAGHKHEDRVAQELPDGSVLAADGDGLHRRDRSGTAVEPVPFDFTDTERVLYLDTTTAASGTEQYWGYRLWRLGGPLGVSAAPTLEDGYHPDAARLVGHVNATARFLEPGLADLGLFSIPLDQLRVWHNETGGETLVYLDNGLDEPARGHVRLVLPDTGGLAGVPGGAKLGEWRGAGAVEVLLAFEGAARANTSQRVYLDASAPVTRLLPADGAFVGAPVVTLRVDPASADDHDLADIRIAGCVDACPAWTDGLVDGLSPGQGVTLDFSAILEGDGAYRFQAVGTDLVGNEEPLGDAEATVVLDTTAPATTLTLPEGVADAWTTAVPDIELACDDGAGSGCALTERRLDEGAWTSAAVPFAPAEGWHVLDVRSTDNVQNVEAPQRVAFGYDASPPELFVEIPPSPATGWYREAVDLTLTCGDLLSGCAAIVLTPSGADALPEALRVDHRVEGDALHVLDALVRDEAGNLASRQIRVPIDAEMPTTTHRFDGTPANGRWFRDSVVVNLSCSDALSGCAGIETSLDLQTWTPYTGEIVQQAPADVTLHYRGRDVAGNVETPRLVQFGIDRLPPRTAATLPALAAGQVWHVEPFSVSLTCVDGGSECARTSYRVDGGAWQRYEAPVPMRESGIHLLEFRSEDHVGNLEPIGSVTVRLDIDSPAIALAQPDAAYAQRLEGLRGTGASVAPAEAVVTLVPAVGEPIVLRAPLVEGAWDAAAQIPGTIPEGVLEIRAWLETESGKTSAVLTRSLRLDRSAPILDLTAPTGLLGTVTWPVVAHVADASPTGDILVEARWGAATDALGAWEPLGALTPEEAATLRLPSGDGHYEVRASVTDVAGNAAESTPTRLQVDTTPPEIVVTSPSTVLARETPYVLRLEGQDATGIGRLHAVLTRDDGNASEGDLDVDDPQLAIPLLSGTRALAYRVTAIDLVGNVRILEGTVRVLDATAPTLSLTLQGTQGAGGWHTSAVEGTLRADDADASIRHRLYREGTTDLPAFQEGATFRLAESGRYVLEAVANAARNGATLGSPPLRETILVDLETPTARVLEPIDEVPDGKRIDVVLEAHDAISGIQQALALVASGPDAASVVPLRLEGGAWRVRIGPFAPGDEPTLGFRVVDAAGHVHVETPRPISVVDGTPPLVAFATRMSGIQQGMVELRVSASDASGIAEVALRVGDVLVGADDQPPYTFAWDTRSFANGDHTLRATARDNEGREATDALGVSVANAPLLGELHVEPHSTTEPTSRTDALAADMAVATAGGRASDVSLLHRVADEGGAFTRIAMQAQPCDETCGTVSYHAEIPGPFRAGTTLEVYAEAVDGTARTLTPVASIEVKLPEDAAMEDWSDEADASFRESESIDHDWADIAEAAVLHGRTWTTFAARMEAPFHYDAKAHYYVELSPAANAPVAWAYNLTYAIGTSDWTVGLMDVDADTPPADPGEVELHVREDEWALRVRTADLAALFDEASDVHVRFRTNGSEDLTGRAFLDVAAPLITHTPPASAPRGGTITLEARASDNVGVARLEVLARVDGRPLPAIAFSDGRASLPLPDGARLDYELRAVDVHGNAATLPVENVSLVDVTPPVARLALVEPASAYPEGAEVAFSAEASTDDVGILAYVWDFDAADGIQEDASGRRVSRAFPALGTYTITLEVRDGVHAARATRVIVIEDVTPPTVRITQPAAGAVLSAGSTPIHVEAADANGVSRVEVRVDSGAWHPAVPDGPGAWMFPWIAAEGAHTLDARAFDAAGNIGAPLVAVQLQADATPPVASLAAPATRLPVDTPFAIQAIVTESIGLARVAWTFGDGAQWTCVAGACTSEGEGTSGSALAPVHRYARPGAYAIRLEVEDHVGQRATATLSVEAYAPPASQQLLVVRETVATIAAAPDALRVGEDAAFRAAAPGSNQATILAYVWNFGDGQKATGQEARHAYAMAGDYTVTLTVTSVSGRTATAQHVVRVAPPADPEAAPAHTLDELVTDVTGEPDATKRVELASFETGTGSLRIVHAPRTNRTALVDESADAVMPARLVAAQEGLIEAAADWQLSLLDAPNGTRLLDVTLVSEGEAHARLLPGGGSAAILVGPGASASFEIVVPARALSLGYAAEGPLPLWTVEGTQIQWRDAEGAWRDEMPTEPGVHTYRAVQGAFVEEPREVRLRDLHLVDLRVEVEEGVLLVTFSLEDVEDAVVEARLRGLGVDVPIPLVAEGANYTGRLEDAPPGDHDLIVTVRADGVNFGSEAGVHIAESLEPPSAGGGVPGAEEPSFLPFPWLLALGSVVAVALLAGRRRQSAR